MNLWLFICIYQLIYSQIIYPPNPFVPLFTNWCRIRGYCERFSYILIKCFSWLANIEISPIPSPNYKGTYWPISEDYISNLIWHLNSPVTKSTYSCINFCTTLYITLHCRCVSSLSRKKCIPFSNQDYNSKL